MLFDTFDFAIFFPIVFAIYWSISRWGIKVQNFFLIIASYYFYACWDVRFLSLIILSSLVDFIIGALIGNSSKDKVRRRYLLLSIFFNIGLLITFKYFNFFIYSFQELFNINQNNYWGGLHFILPVGISFYTFQTLSYSIDVYRGNIKATKDPISFFAFVCFFPQLVAGPIERASHFLPQFNIPRQFNKAKASDGLRQILWGLFKKMVIADNCAYFVDIFFADPSAYQGSALLLGAIFFAFQIYGDFSGYSDIAIGTSRLLGFDLKRNFNYPYFSRNIADFWRRWHISLSSWFKDYLYIPLGGSRLGQYRTLLNVFIVFVVTGLWHGANWTFLFWGIANG